MCAAEFHGAPEHRSGSRRCGHQHKRGDSTVLGWALIFFIVALISGYLGFFGLAGMAASIAKVLFLIFLVLLVVSFIVRAFSGKSVL
jgi:uncharacterized membrane protein YtjA (UPF0391 family)